LTKINVVVCKPNAIAWCTKKSPGPIVKNNELPLLLIASAQPGNQTFVPATVAGLFADESSTSKPYKALPEAA
jgi:hypothetical protein